MAPVASVFARLVAGRRLGELGCRRVLDPAYIAVAVDVAPAARCCAALAGASIAPAGSGLGFAEEGFCVIA